MLLPAEWIARLGEFERLLVGFSGGLDSTVLLHALSANDFLREKLLAVHVNHGLSPYALQWQQHCENFCAALTIAFESHSVIFDRSANLEERARNARYAVFSAMLRPNDCLLLAHHQDDQAETLLLHLFRGAGVNGLAAMPIWGRLSAGAVARPFLSFSRQQLESYAQHQHLQWIDDESNQDVTFSRNYLRQTIMPLLQKKWPGISATLARTAQHCQQACVSLEALALSDCPDLASATPVLSIASLRYLSEDRMMNVLRLWLKCNHIRLPSAATLQRIMHEGIFASTDATPLISWGSVEVRRYQDALYLEEKQAIHIQDSVAWQTFPQPLFLVNTQQYLAAKKADRGILIPPDAEISVRFRQGGEQMRLHGQTKELKKLFQHYKIPVWQRQRIPLLYINQQLAAVIGYAVSDAFFTKDSLNAWDVSAWKKS